MARRRRGARPPTEQVDNFPAVRYFQPGVENARRVLEEAGLPVDVERYVRLRPDDTWADDLRSWKNLKVGESAVTSQHLAERFWGRGSDQHRAADFLYRYARMVGSLKHGDCESSSWWAARLAVLAMEIDYGPALALARKVDQNQRGLSLGTHVRQERTEERKAEVMQRAVEIKRAHPKLSDTAIAKIISKERGADVSARTIRKYLSEPLQRLPPH